jgi:antitoxin HicB
MSAKKTARPKAKRRRSIKGFTTLDEVLAKDGTLEEFEAVAIKEVIAWQIKEAMAEAGLSRHKLAAQLHTSRSQLNRVLDPKDGNITLETLVRVARVVGRELRLELV